MMGYADLWILAAAPDRHVDREGIAAQNRLATS